MMGLFKSIKKLGGKALNVASKGVQSADKAYRDNEPMIKKRGKQAYGLGLSALDKVTKAGQNASKNIAKQQSGVALDLGFGGGSKSRKSKRKRKSKGKGKKVVIYLK